MVYLLPIAARLRSGKLGEKDEMSYYGLQLLPTIEPSSRNGVTATATATATAHGKWPGEHAANITKGAEESVGVCCC